MKRPTRWGAAVQVTLATSAILVLLATFFIVKERATLKRLMHPELMGSPTAVYSRWLDLSREAAPPRARVEAWLEMIGYQRVDGRPAQPGTYSTGFGSITAFTRPFRYPDKDYPAQLLEMDFSRDALSDLKSVAGDARLEEWRLEPKTLAEWEALSKTSRDRVRIAELPPHVPRAVLAMEDKRFYDHGPFDFTSIARALWVDIRHASLRQGASTITQQLARSIFLDIQRTWRRKFLEALLAIYLEIRYSKSQLLEMYLNQTYWGQDGPQAIVGIESASLSFFGKPARQLTVAESATLAGMLQSPRRYSPRNAPELSLERRKLVLGLMRDQKFIAPEEYRKALVEPVRLSATKKTHDSSYFLAELRSQLAEQYEMTAFLSEGWRIFTTLDPLLQRAAYQSVKTTGPQASLVALDPKTGAILAWVGGTNFQTNPFDHASEAKRQPGSSFKPFVVLAALEGKKFTTASMLEDTPLTLESDTGPWTPQNYDRKFRSKASLWDSLVMSLNVPIVRLAKETGIGDVSSVARRAGISSPLRRDLSLALGSSEVSLLELTGAYGTLASGGLRHEPWSIRSIVGQQGVEIVSNKGTEEFVFEPQVVYLVTRMLEAVLESGTGKASRLFGWTFPAAGKTGTSENYHDAWFVGYTTRLVAGVWVGYDQPKSLGRSAAGIALPIWVDFMKRASVYNPLTKFSEPEGITWKTIDLESGLLAKSGCVKRERTAFLPGTEPSGDCPLHPGGIKGFFKRWLVKKSTGTP